MLCTSCSLFEDSHKKEELPPITQEGKNTFGCLVNGEVWLPKGKPRDFKLDLSYDPTYKNGSFSLAANQYNDSGLSQSIVIGGSNLSTNGSYSLDFVPKSNYAGYFTDYLKGCDYFDKSQDFYRTGMLTISQLDLVKHIISGTFEFTVYQSNCDTLKVSQGRFDMKF